MNTQQYLKHIEEETRKVYSMAEQARKKGLDPVDKVEIPLARSLAEKVVGLISTVYPQMENSGITNRILELEKKYGKLDTMVAFVIAEEVAKQKFCQFSSLLDAVEAGIRIGFAYITLGVVSSPIEGFTRLETKKTREGKEYFVAYFSGPIRSAGTTASCVVLMLIDYLREVFGYAKYDPSEEEVKRYFIENTDYHDRITNLQYLPTEEEMLFLAKNLPIQVDGEPTSKREVSNHKNLERVGTNYIRGGMCLIFSEGLAQKAAKGLRLLKGVKEKGINSTGFDFLEEYIKIHEKREVGKADESPTYIKDIVAGRPVFGHPSRSGGFRFRYGRSRVSGFSAFSLHPATMAITDNFIATGTQLKLERPTKGGVATPCDSIDGPIVKLFNGSVKKIQDMEEAKRIYSDVEEIIYLGDILFPFSDVANRNAMLIKPGYVEEIWELELKEKNLEAVKNINSFDIGFEEALKISRENKTPLHPKFIFYWNEISKEQFLNLVEWLKKAKISKKIIFPYTKIEQSNFQEGKRALELLGVEHDVVIENVVLNPERSNALLVNLGIKEEVLEKESSLKNYFEDKDYSGDVLEAINRNSEFIIKDKSGEFIGTRMGRPEKAKLRKLIGSPNALFVVGKEGGRLRSVNAAYEEGKITGDFPSFYCESCKQETIYPGCEKCGGKTKKMFYCRECGQANLKKCTVHESVSNSHYYREIDAKYYFNKAKENLGLINQEIPPLIKGVRGISSDSRLIENLSKGILRAAFDLQVNKDGTIRFDATELPLVAFKPKEVSTSVEKLIELGYNKDVFGKNLVDENQIVELKPHDILLPHPSEVPEARADKIFKNVADFVDELLVRFYKQDPFYGVKKKEDLVGHLGVCMAPHNCAGVICRIVGFSNALGLYASPYMHAAIRRDCFDYDTYIPVKKNGFWKIEKIGEIVEKLNPDKIVDGFGTKEKSVDNFKTVSFEKNLKESKINNFTKHKKRKMYEIKTSLGKSFKVTENHKFLIDGKKKRAIQLRIGDKLPLPKKINIKSKNIREINLIDFLKDENLMVRNIKGVINKIDKKILKDILKELNISKKQFINFHIRDSYPLKFVLELDDDVKKIIYKKGKLASKRDNVGVPIVIELTDSLLGVIGLYVAEGYSRSVKSKKGLNQAYIASDDKKIRKFVEKTIFECFGLIKTENKNDRVTFSSRILYLFFTKILKSGSDAKNKRIPYLFLALPLKRLASLLRGYFEGDGSVSFSDIRVTCDTVSEGLLNDLEFCLSRFGIFAKRYAYKKEPGPKLRDFYLRKGKEIPKFEITKLILGSDFIKDFKKIGFLSSRKNKIFNNYFERKPLGMRIDYDSSFVYDPIVSINFVGEKESYCLNVASKSHLVIGNSILSVQCDGDEAAVMLLGDVLLNFSRSFLPGHRGGTQDAPLVLNAKIDAGEVDDQILDFEIMNGVNHYPLELYRKAEQKKHSSEVEVYNVKQALKEGVNPFKNIGFTHNTSDFNKGIVCSNYKLLATMREKVRRQMELVEKIRAADTSDTVRLVIERHFMRDLRGNLRQFAMQNFRCVQCNEIMRRPPLTGKCIKCGGKIIFTTHEGGIKKYLEPALELVEKYDLSPYIKQTLELTKRHIDSVFGKEPDQQENLGKWF